MNINLALRFLSVLFVVVVIASCASKKEAHEEDSAEQKEWKEMDDFHMLMAETFHPYKDSANLEPIKSKANDLARAADTWVGSKLPEKVNNDDVKDKLSQLKTETASLAQTVSSGDDKAIAEQLTKVHDLFHSIQEEWYEGHH